MTDITEKALLAAFVTRMKRMDGSSPYSIDINDNVLEQRIDFSDVTETMPLVSVILHGGSFADIGTSPRYADQITEIEIVGCIAAGNEDRVKPLDLLLDMKTAAFASNTDVIDDCVSYLRARDWAVFLATRGEKFTQVSLYLEAQWADDAVEQD